MTYTFKLSDYYDIFRQLDEEFDGSFGELEPIKIKETKDSELYVYPLRTVIPTLDISIREGLEYFGPSDGDGSDALVIYEARETDPDKYLDCFSGAEFCSFVRLYAFNQGISKDQIDDLECIIGDSEFIFFD